MAGDILPMPPTTFPADEPRLSSSIQNSKRRRFQVPITRYFSNTESLSLTPDRATLSPPLPETIQSNLLTVGMRIRKSVPEGYKTTISKHAFSDSHVPIIPSTTDVSNHSRSHAAFTELAPYCGLHKVGGLAVQPLPTIIPNMSSAFTSAQSTINLSAAEQDEEQFSVPSSQESSISTASDIQPLRQNNNKRVFDDHENDEEDLDETGDHSLPYDNLNNTAPTRLLELNTLMRLGQPHHDFLSTSGRTLAKPRTRKSQQKQSHRPHSTEDFDSLNKAAHQEGQENLSAFSYMPPPPAQFGNHGEEPDFDFGEATFLRNREDVDMDMGM